MSQLVQFEGVTKRYGSRTVIDNLSFSVDERGVTGLLGPNGAGKSTAMRLLLSVARANAGRISLFGAAPGTAEYRRAIHRVGAHVEEPALYDNASGRANLELQAVSLGISRRDPRIARLLDQVGLSARGGDRVKKYSLGMRQRLGLALALVNEPELVILDEPTNGLDPAGVVEIRELIRSLPAGGTTVLVSSHVLAEIQRTADHLVIIDQGWLVADGTVAEVLAGADRSGHLVRVADTQRTVAAAALEAIGLIVAADDDGMLVVTGEISGGAQIARALAVADVYPDELRPRGNDLEAAFLRITGGVSGDTGGPKAAK
ncbi:MAG: ATP-binding cassette domain-containing protein [Vicinamibacterales bacterium]|nr:ATP-binding cassette domain-containing protein [Vicinamibacterales bacterium]